MACTTPCDVRQLSGAVDGRTVLRFAAVYGFRNIQTLVRKIKMKRCEYDYVEVMACPSGGPHRTRSRQLALARCSSLSGVPRVACDSDVCAVIDSASWCSFCSASHRSRDTPVPLTALPCSRVPQWWGPAAAAAGPNAAAAHCSTGLCLPQCRQHASPAPGALDRIFASRLQHLHVYSTVRLLTIMHGIAWHLPRSTSILEGSRV